MTKSKSAADIAQQLAPGTEVSSRTSAIPAGQIEQDAKRERGIDTINQVFALFRLNYHNQFYAAFPDAQQLNQVKRLWLDALSEHAIDVVLKAAKLTIEQSEYLPTLHRMLDACQQVAANDGLPAPRDAFIEACQKPSPKAEQTWSHPAVYFAGRDSDWFFLAGNPEAKTFPVFNRHYANYVKRCLQGETLSMPRQPELADTATQTAMTTAERKAALAQLRQELKL